MEMASCGQVMYASPVEQSTSNASRNIASADETVQIKPTDQPPYLITHPTTVRCILPLSTTDLAEPYVLTGAGDMIRVYDVSSPQEPELISEMDAHWHDVTALRLWVRKFAGDDGRQRVEPWIISASLDGTIRKWRLTGERAVLARASVCLMLALQSC